MEVNDSTLVTPKQSVLIINAISCTYIYVYCKLQLPCWPVVVIELVRR